MTNIDQLQSPRLEELKRSGLIDAIEDILPLFASQDTEIATTFARSTLEEIQMGNNPDLEGRFRRKIIELGIDLA